MIRKAKLVAGSDSSVDSQIIAIAGIVYEAKTKKECLYSRCTEVVNYPNSCIGEALGVLCLFLKVIDKTKEAKEHEVITHNDNEALVDKTNEDCLH